MTNQRLIATITVALLITSGRTNTTTTTQEPVPVSVTTSIPNNPDEQQTLPPFTKHVAQQFIQTAVNSAYELAQETPTPGVSDIGTYVPLSSKTRTASRTHHHRQRHPPVLNSRRHQELWWAAWTPGTPATYGGGTDTSTFTNGTDTYEYENGE